MIYAEYGRSTVWTTHCHFISKFYLEFEYDVEKGFALAQDLLLKPLRHEKRQEIFRPTGNFHIYPEKPSKRRELFIKDIKAEPWRRESEGERQREAALRRDITIDEQDIRC